MSKLTEALRERRVFNSSNFYGGQPYIWKRTSHGYRDVLPSAWLVAKKDEDLNDGKGVWYEHGRRWFSGFGSEVKGMKRGLDEAIEWATKRFGITDWTRDPFGSYGSGAFINKRIAEILGTSLDKPYGLGIESSVQDARKRRKEITMAQSEKMELRAKAMKLHKAGKPGLEGFRTMSLDALRVAVEQAEHATASPNGKKGSTRKSLASNGKVSGAATRKALPKKSAPAESKSAAPKKATAKGAEAKRPTRKATPSGQAAKPVSGAKPTRKAAPKKSAAETQAKRLKESGGLKAAGGRVITANDRSYIDNSKIDWTAESNVGSSPVRKEIVKLAKKFKGDKGKVYAAHTESEWLALLNESKRASNPRILKADVHRKMVWLIGRVIFDFVLKTGQHEVSKSHSKKIRKGHGNGDKPVAKAAPKAKPKASSKATGSPRKPVKAQGGRKSTPTKASPQKASQGHKPATRKSTPTTGKKAAARK